MKDKKNKMKFHHIGIATGDIEKAVSDYTKMHNISYISDIIYDEQQESYLAYIETNENINVEFIAGDKVKNLIDKGITFYHLCYTVDDINESIGNLRESGAVLVSPPKPAILFSMRKVAFLFTPNGLIELLEESK